MGIREVAKDSDLSLRNLEFTSQVEELDLHSGS